jgi:predicted transcriptional regulator
MSTAQVIAEIEALPPAEREEVLNHFLKLRENEIPAAFRRSMADAAAGRGVDMETALREDPPER